MYSTCISCGAPLGRNDTLEQFPVGRRIAFDPYKGRLWVLCSRCRSWNLAPIDERWEAVEGAERLFERAAVGASTENVALGRIPEGLELVRVGRVERPEFAGWRYGDRLLERRKRFRDGLTSSSPSRREDLALTGVWAATITGGVFLSPWLFPVGFAAWMGAAGIQAHRSLRRPAMSLGEGDQRYLMHYQTTRARLVGTDTEEGWSVAVPEGDGKDLLLRGDEALRLLRVALPRINEMGSSERAVRSAVADVERLGSAEEVMRAAARILRENRTWWAGSGKEGSITGAPDQVLVAIEVAANEEVERRALEGETSQLEREWREAEEIATIADSLLLPSTLTERIRRWKGGDDSTGATDG